MADSDDTKIPLVSNSALDDDVPRDEITAAANDGQTDTKLDNVTSDEAGVASDDNEPLIKPKNTQENDDNTSKKDDNDAAAETGGGAADSGATVASSKTEKQLQNYIDLSPNTSQESVKTTENEKNETKEEKKESKTNDNDNEDDDDDEPHIMGIGGSSSSTKPTEKETSENDKKKDDIILSVNNNNNNNMETKEEESNEIKTLKDEISKLKEKIQNLQKNPINFFERNFENTLKNLGARQRRQRESQRERLKNRELNIRQQKLLKGHFGKVYCLDWTLDSEEIVSCSQDAKILIWNAMTTHKRVAIPLMTAWTMTCCWSNNSEMIACGGLDNTISIYRIKRDVAGWESKRPYIELLDHNGYISDIKFIDDRHLVSSSGDASAMLFDIEKECAISQFKHKGDVMSLSIHKNENLLLTGSTDGTAKIWDIRMAMNGNNNDNNDNKEGGGNPLSVETESKENDNNNNNNGNKESNIFSVSSKHSFSSNNASDTSYSSDVNSVSWFPDGSAFAIGCDDSHVKLFDLRTNCQLISYYDSENTCNVTDLDISKSGKYIYATYDNDPWCVVWDTATGDKKQTIVHPSRPACLRVSPHGYCFATGCWDTKIRIWAP